MKIVFLHPDLGIGGAERLVVDAAIAMKSKEHSVHFITCHHDPEHCFKETKDGTLDVTVVGDWLPRSVCGKFYAACAYIRMIYAAFFLIFFSEQKPDIVFCDQVSACIPVLKMKHMKVIFYCHFPDQLLTQRKNWLKWFYRLPLDWIEEWTTGLADTILVNSSFTSNIFRSTFKSLREVNLEVVHPTINFASLAKPVEGVEVDVKTGASTIFLSLNRYERKKNIALAISALCELKKMLPAEEAVKIHLIIAGGYDERVLENIEHFVELTEFAKELNVNDQVSFLKSPNDSEKQLLLHSCTALLYTPSNEHFGIVPLEAMFLGRPVIACNSGGPLETVIDEETGYLCEPNAKTFAEKMKLFARDRSLARELGSVGANHVRKNFSFIVFTEKLNKIIEKLA